MVGGGGGGGGGGWGGGGRGGERWAGGGGGGGVYHLIRAGRGPALSCGSCTDSVHARPAMAL